MTVYVYWLRAAFFNQEPYAMSKQAFFIIALITGLFSLAMFLFPQIDLTVSGFFYQPHQGFLLERWYNRLHLNIFRNTLVYTTYILLTVMTICLIAQVVFKKLVLPISPVFASLY